MSWATARSCGSADALIKIVPAFDLIGLFTGSEGMLGLVTEATMRLIPLPPTRSCLRAEFASVAKAAAGVQKILGSGLLPCALEIADPFTLAAARKAIPNTPNCDSMLIVEFDGQPSSVKSELAAATKVLRPSSSKIVTAHGNAACEKIWEIRRGFSYALRDTGLVKLNEDVTVPRGRVVDLFRLTARLQKKYGVPISSFGHAGDGNIHVNLMAPVGTKPDDRHMHRILDELFRGVLQMGGVISGEHGIGLGQETLVELCHHPRPPLPPQPNQTHPRSSPPPQPRQIPLGVRPRV